MKDSSSYPWAKFGLWTSWDFKHVPRFGVLNFSDGDGIVVVPTRRPIRLVRLSVPGPSWSHVGHLDRGHEKSG